MECSLEGSSAFRYLKVSLATEDRIISEAGAMASMDTNVDIQARFFGGLFSGFVNKYLGGESLFINEYSNMSDSVAELYLSSGFPGDIASISLADEGLYLQPGAFLAATTGLKFSVGLGGISYFMAGEGLFKLRVYGTGRLWITCYGALVRKQVNEEYIVDTGHLVAYEPHLSLSTKLSGSLFSSVFGGEGFVTRIRGNGVVYLQSRSLHSFTNWLVPRL
jgi:uncharacterized protein (TIGR00266 family)